MENRRQVKSKIAKAVILCFTFLFFLNISPGVSKAENRKDRSELHGLWISYLEFLDRLKDPETGAAGFTPERFEKVINEMFDNAVSLKMNAVFVQVRPFGDAFYPSGYFPWSKYISGTQGVDPGFDPLQYMIYAAHERDLKFHAWINPYRVTSNSTDINLLSKDNKAREWLTDSSKSNDRRVLSFGGSLYYNPSDPEVQLFICKGIEEIITNYDVDGIHFDDYFYPTLGANYKKSFDYPEYKKYISRCREAALKPRTIADWRRDNINNLIQRVYKLIKEKDKTIEFGISPMGNPDVLQMDDRYYCDIKTWLSNTGYIDYIAPQIYWSFRHPSNPFDKTLEDWLLLKKNPKIKMYVGIAAYKAGSNDDSEWKSDKNVLKNQVEYGRGTNQVDGYLYFRYDFFYKKETKNAIKNLLDTIS